MTKIDFNIYNAQNAPHVSTTVSYNRRLNMGVLGGFQISKGAAGILGVKEGDRIVFLQDKRYTTDWYIAKTDEPTGYRLTGNKHGQVCFKSNTLAKAIAASVLKDKAFTRASFGLSATEYGLCIDCKHPKVTTR